MPEVIKSFIVLFVLGNALLFFHRRNLATTTSIIDFRQWHFLWLAVTSAAFLSQNYWLFILLTIIILKLRDSNDIGKRYANYLWLLPLLPLLSKDIPGFGGIRFLFELNFPRLLSLVILLPIFLNQRDRSLSFFRLTGDKILALYLLVNIIINFRNGEITNILRSDFYLFTDIFLPYYAASRSLKQFVDFERVGHAMFISISLLALIGIFEAIRGWHLYSSLSYSLDIAQRFSSYLFREGFLRATGPFSSGIVLGYVLTIGLGMGLAVMTSFKNKGFFLIIIGIYTIGLISTASRGPWVGAFLMYLIFVLFNRNRGKLIKKSLFASILLAPIALFSPYGQKILSMLPFIGESGGGTISYRQELLEKSWIVIQRHPFLGSDTYLETPEMQSLIQGQGIIDIVNSYLRIGLDSGLTGMIIFILFFMSITIKLYRLRHKIERDNIAEHNYAVALVATMLAILFIIATVSSIDVVSHLYWGFAGIMTAYIHYLKRPKTEAES